MPAKKLQLRKPSPGAAYLVADGITADEADAQGLIVVESDPFGNPLAFGKYEELVPVEE